MDGALATRRLRAGGASVFLAPEEYVGGRRVLSASERGETGLGVGVGRAGADGSSYGRPGRLETIKPPVFIGDYRIIAIDGDVDAGRRGF